MPQKKTSKEMKECLGLFKRILREENVSKRIFREKRFNKLTMARTMVGLFFYAYKKNKSVIRKIAIFYDNALKMSRPPLNKPFELDVLKDCLLSQEEDFRVDFLIDFLEESKTTIFKSFSDCINAGEWLENDRDLIRSSNTVPLYIYNYFIDILEKLFHSNKKSEKFIDFIEEEQQIDSNILYDAFIFVQAKNSGILNTDFTTNIEALKKLSERRLYLVFNSAELLFLKAEMETDKSELFNKIAAIKENELKGVNSYELMKAIEMLFTAKAFLAASVYTTNKVEWLVLKEKYDLRISKELQLENINWVVHFLLGAYCDYFTHFGMVLVYTYFLEHFLDIISDNKALFEKKLFKNKKRDIITLDSIMNSKIEKIGLQVLEAHNVLDDFVIRDYFDDKILKSKIKNMKIESIRKSDLGNNKILHKIMNDFNLRENQVLDFVNDNLHHRIEEYDKDGSLFLDLNQSDYESFELIHRV
tara:strand:+ start:52433 stop:53854 length:1422 start_codon:yes stop_codon:yes gene_type:complete